MFNRHLMAQIVDAQSAEIINPCGDALPYGDASRRIFLEKQMNQQMAESQSDQPSGIVRFDNPLADQFGPSRASAEAVAHARAGLYGAITVERSVRPNGDEWYHLYVSLGDGDFTSINIGKVLPDESALRPMAMEKAVAAVAQKLASSQKRADAVTERLRLIEEKGIRIGRQWNGAQAYVQGRTGLTTYDRATVVGIDESGFVTVECYKRGMRAPERITTDANGQLFDSLSEPSLHEGKVLEKAALAQWIVNELAGLSDILASRITLPEGHEWVEDLIDPPLSGGPVHATAVSHSIQIKRKLAEDGSTAHMDDVTQISVEVRVFLPERAYVEAGVRKVFRKGAELEARLWVRSGPQWAGKGTYRIEALKVGAATVEELGDRVADIVNEHVGVALGGLSALKVPPVGETQRSNKPFPQQASLI